MKNTQFYFTWILQIISAIILFQTLFFKFSASPESVYIFSKIGFEPVGRIGIGVAELIASVLLLTPALAWFGALMGVGLMAGALFFHLTKLGIVVQNDGGYLFVLCLVVFVSSALIMFFRRMEIPYYDHLSARL